MVAGNTEMLAAMKQGQSLTSSCDMVMLVNLYHNMTLIYVRIPSPPPIPILPTPLSEAEENYTVLHQGQLQQKKASAQVNSNPYHPNHCNRAT
jgi:hypothetical protein